MDTVHNSQNNMNMQGLLIILSTTLFDQQFVTAYNGIKLIKEVGKNICPYTTYCHTDASRNLNTTVDDFIPSCLPCSCNEDCWDYRTCCPDKETDSRSTTLPCKLSLVKGPTVSYTLTVEDVLIQRIGANYRVVDHCPSSVNNKTVREKCEAKEGDRLQDYVWVSESANGMIYQNIHCAECHGVSQVWHWDIRTSCFEILDTFVNIEDTLMGTDCDITNTAPDDKASIVSKYRCYDFDLEDYLYSDCNVSTDRRNDFLTACNKSTWPYIVAESMQDSGKYYKNVFCYACQFGIDAVTTSIPHKHPTLGTRIPSISFSAVLNYREQPKGIGIDGHRSCLSNQIFDNYMNMCLGLICPFGKYPLNGQCVQKYLGLRYSCLCVIYYIEVFLDQLKMKQFEYGEFMDYLDFVESEGLNHSLKIALAGRSGCNVTTSQVSKIRFANNFKPTYSVSFLVQTKPTCDLYNVIENALELIDGSPVNRVINSSVDLRLKISLITNGSKTTCGKCYLGLGALIRIDNDILCPQIELDFFDVERFASDEQKKERAIFLAFFDDKVAPSKTKVRMCIDDYLAAMSTVNSGCSIIAASIILSFLFCFMHLTHM